jgi:hypothetical protein
MAITKFFEIFSIGEGMTPGGEMGLDLPLAHRILSLFGGSVTAENRQPVGIRLPRYSGQLREKRQLDNIFSPAREDGANRPGDVRAQQCP